MGSSGGVLVWVGMLCGTAAMLVTTPTAAQRRWQSEVRLATEVRYDDNLFLLPADRKGRLAQPTAADLTSGRFVDMESASDVVPVPALRLTLDGPGLGGRRMTAVAHAEYDFNVRNDRRRHVELGVAVEQSVAAGARLRLSADFRPHYFSKNYLADALDGNADGTITPDERRYAPATSDELTVGLRWRQRLLRPDKSRNLGLEGSLTAGYGARTFDAPFGGRTRRGPTAGVALRFDLGRRWSLEADYDLSIESADVTRDVSLLDEPAFGQDFNGNGNATDLNARAFELVDRSRTEHRVGLAVQTALGQRVDLAVSYDRRMRIYRSQEPFDVANRDRHDALDEIGAELDLGVAVGLQLTLGASYGAQGTDRAADPGATGEVTDYKRTQLALGLRYRF